MGGGTQSREERWAEEEWARRGRQTETERGMGRMKTKGRRRRNKWKDRSLERCERRRMRGVAMGRKMSSVTPISDCRLVFHMQYKIYV